MKKYIYILSVLVLLLLISNIYLLNKLDHSADIVGDNSENENDTEITVQILSDEEISKLVDKAIIDYSDENGIALGGLKQIKHNELLFNQGINSVPIILNKLQNIENNGFEPYKYAYLLQTILKTNLEYSSGKEYLYTLAEFNHFLGEDMNYLKKKIAESHGEACLHEMIINMSILSLPILEEYVKYGRIDINDSYLELLNHTNKNNEYTEGELLEKVNSIRAILNEIYESMKSKSSSNS